MFINVWERGLGSLKNDPVGRQIADLMLQLNKSYSHGTVDTDPRNPFGMPKVRFNLLGDPRDRIRMVNGFRFIGRLLSDPVVKGMVNETFQARLTPATMKLLQDTRQAQLLSTFAAVAFSGPGALRRRLLRASVTPLDDVFDDERLCDQFVFENVSPGGHHVGTCRMGPKNHQASVTDSRCRVIGVDGLRVVDASIFPTPLTAGTNLPVMMAAERAADMIKEDHRSRL
jgi:5-(hydroxymethyl)furfural/furfural oxidase